MADGFGIVALPTVRALLSRTVPNTSQGKLFAALEMLQSGSSLLSQLIIPVIYRRTVQTFPQLICFVVAGIWGTALMLTAYVKSRELVGLTDAEADGILGTETATATVADDLTEYTNVAAEEEEDDVENALLYRRRSSSRMMDNEEIVRGEIEAEVGQGLDDATRELGV
jgi:hypothetical protein